MHQTHAQIVYLQSIHIFKLTRFYNLIKAEVPTRGTTDVSGKL